MAINVKFVKVAAGGVPSADILYSGAPATGEPNLRAGIKETSPGVGTFNTLGALAHAYGAPVSEVKGIVSKANQTRAAAPEVYNLQQVPYKVPFDNTGQFLANHAAVNTVLLGGRGNGQYVGNGWLDRFFDRYPKYEPYKHKVRRAENISRFYKDNVPAEAYRYAAERDGGSHFAIPNGTVKEIIDRRLTGQELPYTVYGNDETWTQLAAASNGNLSTYSGELNPFTNVSVLNNSTNHSIPGHEFTHALNAGLNSEATGERTDALRESYDTNRNMVEEMPTSTYNSSDEAEATQNSAQMKRLAYNRFYQQNGRFPQGEQELRGAYNNILRYEIPEDPSIPGTAYNPEHARFINEMTPSDPNMTREQRQKAYNDNSARWLNNMLRKDENGNFYQDALVRNNSGMGKVASYELFKNIVK